MTSAPNQFFVCFALYLTELDVNEELNSTTGCRGRGLNHRLFSLWASILPLIHPPWRSALNSIDILLSPIIVDMSDNRHVSYYWGILICDWRIQKKSVRG